MTHFYIMLAAGTIAAVLAAVLVIIEALNRMDTRYR